MVLKTYRAPDLQTALARARRELGPNALVMATREEKGSLGIRGVEVTVGVERPARPRGDGDLLRRLARQVALESERREARATTPTSAPAGTSSAPPRDDVHQALDAATQVLIRAGLDADLALRFSRIAEREAGLRPDASDLARATERAMAGLVPLTGLPLEQRCLIVAGPPGVGKTTTAAKLAACARGPVWFATADQERIGAVEQARIFSASLGARFASIESGADLARLLREAPRNATVLVDKPGIGAGDSARMERLGELRDAATDAAMILMMPAGLQRDVAASTLERFDSFEPDCAAFSKIDDGGRIGELVTALLPTRIPLSFTTHGHRVPDDLSVASARGLVSMMLRQKAAPVEVAR